MVKAELIYNPYLLHTDVLFDGKPPRINSLIEKYQDEKLQSWIDKIPSIFYDEMNGYGFELDFSGTNQDYEDVLRSFDKLGVGEDKVKIVYKNRLQERMEKVNALDELIGWLKETDNPEFDSNEFFEERKELFEGAYPIVVLGQKIESVDPFEDIEVSTEYVESAKELAGIELNNTPVVVMIDSKSIINLQNNLQILLARLDVAQNQLFFMVSRDLNEEKTYRVLEDLGVEHPQMLLSFEDEKLRTYMETFPITEYIIDSIREFRTKTDKIQEKLNREIEESQIANREIHNQIDYINQTIDELRECKDFFESMDVSEIAEELMDIKNDVIKQVIRWKNRHTKLTNEENAKSFASDYDNELKKKFQLFLDSAHDAHFKKLIHVIEQFRARYEGLNCRDDFNLLIENEIIKLERPISGMSEELLQIKEEQYVTPKTNYLGKLFHTQQTDPDEKVLETVYYLENWRNYAASAFEKEATSATEEIIDRTKNLFDRIVSTYTAHVAEMIENAVHEKEKVSSQLSEEERKLQEKNDWLMELIDKIHGIERN